MKTQGKLYGNTNKFQEGDAANETSCAPFVPNRSTGPSPSSKHHKYNMHRYRNAPIQSEEEDFTTRP